MKKKKIILLSSIILVLIILIVTTIIVFINLNKYENDREYYWEKIAEFKEENKNIESSEVVFLGDSLTDRYELDIYYPDLEVLNRGIDGDKTEDVLYRLDCSVNEIKPKVVVLLIGVNDVFAQVKQKNILKNVEKIIDEIQEKSPYTRILLQSYYPLSGYNNNITLMELNVEMKKIADLYGVVFVDVYSCLVDPNTGEINSNYTSDGVHLTETGYEVVTQVLTPYIMEMLDKEYR